MIAQVVVFVGIEMNNEIALRFRSLLELMLLLIASWIVYQAFRTRGKDSLSRPIFLLRFLSYPFVQFGGLATLAVQSCHGIEYLGITQQTFARSGSRSVLLRWPLILAFLVLSYTIIHIPFELPTVAPKLRENLGSTTTGLLFSGLYVVKIMHYYLDSCIFRMSDPIVRKNIGPLFKT